MSKRPLIISIVIVISIVGSVLFLLRDSGDKGSQKLLSEPKPSLESDAEDPVTSSAGSYVEYEKDIITNTDGTKLLFFYASWCSQCRALEADIKAKGVPDGVTIIKVDYDANQGLRQQYGVTLQTTFVKVDDSGGFIDKYVAYDSPTIESVKLELL